MYRQVPLRNVGTGPSEPTPAAEACLLAVRSSNAGPPHWSGRCGTVMPISAGPAHAASRPARTIPPARSAALVGYAAAFRTRGNALAWRGGRSRSGGTGSARVEVGGVASAARARAARPEAPASAARRPTAGRRHTPHGQLQPPGTDTSVVTRAFVAARSSGPDSVECPHSEHLSKRGAEVGAAGGQRPSPRRRCRRSHAAQRTPRTGHAPRKRPASPERPPPAPAPLRGEREPVASPAQRRRHGSHGGAN
jgi:hypothetical protein